jgi:hypothetical protein
MIRVTVPSSPLMDRSLGSEASLDEPEPRLALFGPPAITRRMSQLWRADPSLQAKFNIREPLHRRDYALWLSEKGRALGLDRQSIAAGLALARRGASLPRAIAMARAVGNADDASRRRGNAWLEEPVAWEGAAPPDGIPMPRALALLWELRQDVRWHFPNRTRAEVLTYLGWCLTQGVRDKCVAPELVAPALAAFLDTPDADLEAAAARGPPLTRLVRIIAAHHDGPCPEIARDFPLTRHSRLAVAIWAWGRCGGVSAGRRALSSGHGAGCRR